MMGRMAKFLKGREKYGRRRYVRRLLTKQAEKLFFRLDKHALVAAFREVGIKGGEKLFVHSSMNRMGYIEGGAETVIGPSSRRSARRGLYSCPLLLCQDR